MPLHDVVAVITVITIIALMVMISVLAHLSFRSWQANTVTPHRLNAANSVNTAYCAINDIWQINGILERRIAALMAM